MSGLLLATSCFLMNRGLEFIRRLRSKVAERRHGQADVAGGGAEGVPGPEVSRFWFASY